MDAKEFGKFISQLRKEKQLTQAELGKKLQVSDKAVSRWERGLGFPDISTIEPLADALGVSVAEIMKCQRMEEADMKKEEVNAAVESTLDLMKYYEKMERRGKIWSLIMGGIGVLFLCVGIYIEMFMNNMYGMASVNAAIGVIGGADGPTSIFVAGRLGDSVAPWLIGVGIVWIMICVFRLLKKRI